MEIIRSNRKLNFYTIFKTDVSKSEYLEHITNLKHRKTVAKLRSGNHNLRIESGRHCTPKIPEHLTDVIIVTLTKLKTKHIFYCIAIDTKILDKQ